MQYARVGRRLIVVLIIAGVACSAIAQSQQAQNIAAHTPKTDSTKNNGTSAKPIAIKKDIPSQPLNEATNNKGNNTNTLTENGWRNIFLDPTSVFTGIIALFTIGIFWVARDTARRQLRAYLHIPGCVVIHKVDKGTVFEAQVIIKNSGQTPAYNVRLHAKILFNHYPLSESLVTEKKPSHTSEGYVGPGGEITFYPKAKGVLPDALVNHFMEGNTGVYLFGIITYKDVFRKPHVVKFRYIHANRPGMNEDNMHVCHEGNEAD